MTKQFTAFDGNYGIGAQCAATGYAADAPPPTTPHPGPYGSGVLGGHVPDGYGSAAGQNLNQASNHIARNEILLRQLRESLDKAQNLLLDVTQRHAEAEKLRDVERRERVAAEKKASDEKALREIYERLVNTPLQVGVGRPLSLSAWKFIIDPYLPGDTIEIWQNGKKKLTVTGIS